MRKSANHDSLGCVMMKVCERLVRDGAVHGPAVTVARLVSRGYTNTDKTLAASR